MGRNDVGECVPTIVLRRIARRCVQFTVTVMNNFDVLIPGIRKRLSLSYVNSLLIVWTALQADRLENEPRNSECILNRIR